jgi:hypothetical protein
LRKILPAIALSVLLLLVVASQAVAAPSLIEASAKVAYISLDTAFSYGGEIEFANSFFIQYLGNKHTHYALAGVRYFLLPYTPEAAMQTPFSFMFSAIEALRFPEGERLDWLTIFTLGIDYDFGKTCVAIEAGGGISVYSMKPFYLVQLQLGFHYTTNHLLSQTLLQ